jgi:hypothetical protein
MLDSTAVCDQLGLDRLPYRSAGQPQIFAPADVSPFTLVPRSMGRHFNVGEKNAYPFSCLATSAIIFATDGTPVLTLSSSHLSQCKHL